MNDRLLVLLVRLAESLDGLGPGAPTIKVTLNIHGKIITGNLLSLRQYAEAIKKNESLQSVFVKAVARNLTTEEELNNAIHATRPPVGTLDAQESILLASSESGEVWRLRLSDCCGYSLGTISAAV